jgi:hypothetical protein
LRQLLRQAEITFGALAMANMIARIQMSFSIVFPIAVGRRNRAAGPRITTNFFTLFSTIEVQHFGLVEHRRIPELVIWDVGD